MARRQALAEPLLEGQADPLTWGVAIPSRHWQGPSDKEQDPGVPRRSTCGHWQVPSDEEQDLGVPRRSTWSAGETTRIPEFRRRVARIRSLLRDIAVSPAAARLTVVGSPSSMPPEELTPVSAQAGGLSWTIVAVMITNVLVGAGLLGLPYALARAGSVAGLLVISVSAVATATSARMLVWCFETVNVERRSQDESTTSLGCDLLDPRSDPSSLLSGEHPPPLCSRRSSEASRDDECNTYDALAAEVGGALGANFMKLITILECFGGVRG